MKMRGLFAIIDIKFGRSMVIYLIFNFQLNGRDGGGGGVDHYTRPKFIDMNKSSLRVLGIHLLIILVH